MSTQTHDHGHAHGHGEHGHGEAPPLEQEGVNYGSVIGVGVFSLVLFALGGVWSARVYYAGEQANPSPSVPAALREQEKGIVDHVPFEQNTWKRDYEALTARQLGSYQWVDPKAGTVRLPIERAYELVIADAQAANAPPPPPPAPAPPEPPKAPAKAPKAAEKKK